MNPLIHVWLVRESVAAHNSTLWTEQDCFVLAMSAPQAVEIVGEHETRRIVLVQQVCPITQLPDDRYRVQPVVPPQP